MAQTAAGMQGCLMASESVEMVSMMLEVPPQHIAMVKAVIESYDNLATLRTADPVRHHLKLWFSSAQQADVEAVLEELSAACPIHRIA